MRRLADELAATVNVVGYTYRRIKREKRGDSVVNSIHYGVLTVGPEYALTKPFRPLRDAEIPDFAYWLKVLSGAATQQTAPALPGELDTGEADAPPPAPEPDEPAAAQPKAAKASKKASK